MAEVSGARPTAAQASRADRPAPRRPPPRPSTGVLLLQERQQRQLDVAGRAAALSAALRRRAQYILLLPVSPLAEASPAPDARQRARHVWHLARQRGLIHGRWASLAGDARAPTAHDPEPRAPAPYVVSSEAREHCLIAAPGAASDPDWRCIHQDIGPASPEPAPDSAACPAPGPDAIEAAAHRLLDQLPDPSTALLVLVVCDCHACAAPADDPPPRPPGCPFARPDQLLRLYGILKRAVEWWPHVDILLSAAATRPGLWIPRLALWQGPLLFGDSPHPALFARCTARSPEAYHLGRAWMHSPLPMCPATGAPAPQRAGLFRHDLRIDLDASGSEPSLANAAIPLADVPLQALTGLSFDLVIQADDRLAGGRLLASLVADPRLGQSTGLLASMVLTPARAFSRSADWPGYILRPHLAGAQASRHPSAPLAGAPIHAVAHFLLVVAPDPRRPPASAPGQLHFSLHLLAAPGNAPSADPVPAVEIPASGLGMWDPRRAFVSGAAGFADWSLAASLQKVPRQAGRPPPPAACSPPLVLDYSAFKAPGGPLVTGPMLAAFRATADLQAAEAHELPPSHPYCPPPPPPPPPRHLSNGTPADVRFESAGLIIPCLTAGALLGRVHHREWRLRRELARRTDPSAHRHLDEQLADARGHPTPVLVSGPASAASERPRPPFHLPTPAVTPSTTRPAPYVSQLVSQDVLVHPGLTPQQGLGSSWEDWRARLVLAAKLSAPAPPHAVGGPATAPALASALPLPSLLVDPLLPPYSPHQTLGLEPSTDCQERDADFRRICQAHLADEFASLHEPPRQAAGLPTDPLLAEMLACLHTPITSPPSVASPDDVPASRSPCPPGDLPASPSSDPRLALGISLPRSDSPPSSFGVGPPPGREAMPPPVPPPVPPPSAAPRPRRPAPGKALARNKTAIKVAITRLLARHGVASGHSLLDTLRRLLYKRSTLLLAAELRKDAPISKVHIEAMLELDEPLVERMLATGGAAGPDDPDPHAADASPPSSPRADCR
ncbi:hypothetical protein H696_01822 [Fonticula alba]|uniref:Uncharacterized protein n=1 Tax=Fonticula alba TaxID=691883 RepID=A0A058ZA91_FONAL|nr:hypothetical protein H696_01822 [Fonticula alba]KCV70873.1 hypothetical protein H696_01822 [Fonticula alba]|eukprot:XP_009493996.1 hypothetical protein H696_01822 [Fonticula alba]